MLGKVTMEIAKQILQEMLGSKRDFEFRERERWRLEIYDYVVWKLGASNFQSLDLNERESL